MCYNSFGKIYERRLAMNPTIISLILVITASACTIVTSFMKDMRKILFFILAACLATAANYFISDSSGGVATYIIATAVALTGGIFAIKQKPVPAFVVILYCIAYIAANIVAFEAWYTIFAITGAITGVICTTRDNGMSYRIWILANSVLWCCFDIFANAMGPLVQHSLFTVVFTVGLGLDMHKLTKEKKQNGLNHSNH